MKKLVWIEEELVGKLEVMNDVVQLTGTITWEIAKGNN